MQLVEVLLQHMWCVDFHKKLCQEGCCYCSREFIKVIFTFQSFEEPQKLNRIRNEGNKYEF